MNVCLLLLIFKMEFVGKAGESGGGMFVVSILFQISRVPSVLS